MIREISYQGARLHATQQHSALTHAKVFLVQLIEGQWPGDDDLITLCDGDIPPERNHFGGKVSPLITEKGESKDCKIVKVFTD